MTKEQIIQLLQSYEQGYDEYNAIPSDDYERIADDILAAFNSDK
jgi:hypothetical protein